jgi:hypothetical protein
MEPFSPNLQMKNDEGRPLSRTPADPYASLFKPGKNPVVRDSVSATRRIERSSRLASDVKRALFFAVILVFVAVVLYQFVSALRG